MRRTLFPLTLLGLVCAFALGCAEKPQRAMIRAPKEEFTKAPEKLFAGPMQYPDGVLNNVKPRAPKDDKTPPAGWDNGGQMQSGANALGGPGGGMGGR